MNDGIELPSEHRQARVINRWIVVVGAILIQLCLGAIYAWGVFTKRLELPSGDYGFSNRQTSNIFSAGLATFAVVMLLAGRWQARSGPRVVAIAGGLVLGTGYILAGLLGSSFVAQFICIGLIGGAGIGLAYVVPIAVGVKWFPDKKGLITGLAVAGFGFGATIWVKLAGGIGSFDGLLSSAKLFGLPAVQSVFLLYGVVFLVLILLGSLVMVNPPAGWQPGAPLSTSQAASSPASATIDFDARHMMQTPQYWGLLIMFSGSALAGLMMIYCMKLYGVDSLLAGGAAADEQSAGLTADTAIAWLAILNGLGRIVWGLISDKVGRKRALFVMCLSQGIMMLLLLKIGSSATGLIVGACVIGFNFGGNFALFPAATADCFGNKRVGTNYPWVFLAYGIAGIVGPYVAGYFKDAAQAGGAGVEFWQTPFLIAAVACLLAAVIALGLRPVGASKPKPTRHGGPTTVGPRMEPRAT